MKTRCKSVNALGVSVYTQMGRPEGLGRKPGGKRHTAKPGAQQPKKAAARDKRAADAAAAEQEAAAEAMAGMASPATAQQASPATDGKPRPNTAQQDQEARRNREIVGDCG